MCAPLEVMKCKGVDIFKHISLRTLIQIAFLHIMLLSVECEFGGTSQNRGLMALLLYQRESSLSFPQVAANPGNYSRKEAQTISLKYN